MVDEKTISQDEVRKTITQIFKDMEETLKNIEETSGTGKVEAQSDTQAGKGDAKEVSQDGTPTGTEAFEEDDIDDCAKDDTELAKEVDWGDTGDQKEEGAGAGRGNGPTIVQDEGMDGTPNCADMLEMVKEIRCEMGKFVVGYEDVIDSLLIALLSGGHILLEGLPGIAKTTLAKTFTSIFGIECQRIQFTSDMLPQDITGHYYYNQKINEFEFRRGPIFSNLILADEINRTTPRTQSALLESMEECQTTIDGNTMQLPRPFMVIATINPIEQEGVYKLPMSQADRFMMKIDMGYIEREKELEFLRMKANGSKSSKPERRFDIGMMMECYNKTYMHESIVSYINDIIVATRDSDLISIGASPRAAEQMLYASKARACIMGRDYVIPDDVKDVVYNMLNHRMMLSSYVDPDEHSMNSVIRSLIDSVKVPLEER